MAIPEQTLLDSDASAGTVTRSPFGDRRLRFWLNVGLVVLLLGVLASTIRRVLPGYIERTDVTVFIAGGRALLNGGDELYRLTNSRGWFFTSPPMAAVPFVPLAPLPVPVGSSIWYLANVAFLYVILRMTARHLAPERPGVVWEIGWVPCLLLSPMILVTLTRGQWFIAIALLITLAWDRLVRRKEWTAGVLLSLAASIKLLPLIFLPYLLWRRNWKAVLAFVLGLGLWGAVAPALFVGWSKVPGLYQQWWDLTVSGEAGHPGRAFNQLHNPFIESNQSLIGVVQRAYLGTQKALASAGAVDTARTLAACAGGALLAVSAWGLWCSRRRDDARTRAAEMGLVTVAMLLVAPVAWDHYFVALLPAMLLLAADLLRRDRRALAPLLTFLVLMLVYELVKPTRFYGALSVATLVVWAFLLKRLISRSEPATVPVPLADPV